MLLASARGRIGTLLRLAGFAAVAWSIVSAHTAPATSGRGLVVLLALAPACAAWLTWTFWSSRQSFMTPDLYVLAVCGAVIQSASPSSAASVLTFVAAMGAAARCGLLNGLLVAALGAAAIGTGALVYDRGALAVLAYSLGFAATTLGGSNIRQARMRLEQSELLLAQTQRSHEEQLRAARLEESARIAREIHDVLAHSLAGLVIQLEATDALLAQGREPELIRERLQRAHGLAREGLREARRAVGALRGDAPPRTPGRAALETLVEQYEDPIEFTLSGDEQRLQGRVGETVLRVVQEALTNVRKHAPGAAVTIAVTIGDSALEATIDNHMLVRVAHPSLGGAGGGYGLRGMRERATELGGTFTAGPIEHGWRVALHLPLDPRP